MKFFIAAMSLILGSLALAESKWSMTPYGVAELDQIFDTTQGFDEAVANQNVPRPDTFAGQNSNWITSVRHSRAGLRVAAPEFYQIRTSLNLECDFRGNQPPGISQTAFFTNPGIRIRHFFVKFDTPIVDVTIGQTWGLFGWQAVYHPNTVQFQGLPGQVFTRTPQLKISKAFQLSDVKLELAVGVARPPQMQAGVPEGQGGIRASLDSWSATHTTGAVSTSKQPLSLALSGTVRRFVWPETPTSTNAQSQVGWGVAVNGFIPVIPVSGDTSWHSLSLVGEYVYGNGIGDQYSSDTGGLTPAANPAGMIDPALAVLDGNALRLINWQSYRVGLEYYLPILDGRVWLSTNYAHMDSGNLAQLASATAKSSTKTTEDWVDGNLFVEAMPGLRLGIEYAYLLDRYADNVAAKDHRVQLSAFYMF